MRVAIKLRPDEQQELLFGTEPVGSRPRPNLLAAFGSVCLHLSIIGVLFVISANAPPEPLAHRQVTMLSLQNQKLVWYFTKDQLPEVASGEESRPGKPKVELKRPGQVIRSDTQQPPGKQLIWQPPPTIVQQHETPLPNLLAFSPQPPKPQPKRFVPVERSKPVELPKALPEPIPLITAPALSAALPLSTAIPGPAKPRPREFVPSQAKIDAPQQAVVLETAPNLPASAQTQTPSIVVAGLEPSRTNDIPLPEGSRAPRFSAGPESGTGTGQHTASALVVPGLNVSGNGTGTAVVPGPARRPGDPYHEPSAAEWAQAAQGKDSRRGARSVMSAALRPSARVIASSAETRFPNRAVYTTSFEIGTDGAMEWVIWFAEQTMHDGQYITIRPPVPWNRVSTAPERPIPSGRFQVTAVIDKDGQPKSVNVLGAGDQVAKEMAASLIADWLFLPALRNGEPIAVDTLIEISFRRKP
jgi:hypothetical protein